MESSAIGFITERLCKYQTSFITALERLDATKRVAKYKVSTRCRTVSDPKPDHFWRAAQQKTPLRKIRILRSYREPVFQRVSPDLRVGSTAKAAIPHMKRTRIQILQRRNQPR